MSVVTKTSPLSELQITIDEFAREEACRLDAVVQSYLDRFPERDDEGLRLVVRIGRAPTRNISTGAEELEIPASRINDNARHDYK